MGLARSSSAANEIKAFFASNRYAVLFLQDGFYLPVFKKNFFRFKKSS